MAADSRMWVMQVAGAYQALKTHDEAESEKGRRRLTTFLDLVMTARLREVGEEQAINEVREAVGLPFVKY